MDANLEEMAEIIATVRKSIDSQPPYDKFNEARTREVIVAPVLGTMGWDVANFNLVDVEYSVRGGEGRRRVDYALWSPSKPRQAQHDKPVTLLEAKVVGQELAEESVVRSIRNYAFEAGVPYVILTNGGIWQAHVFPSASISDHRQLLPSVNILDSSAEEPDCAKKLVEMFGNIFQVPDGGLSPGWISLEDYLKPTKKYRGPNPRAIRFSDGEEREEANIRGLVKRTADWLHRRGFLQPDLCPASKSRSQEPLVVSANESPSDPQKWQQVESSNLFVRTGQGQKRNVEDIEFLLTHCSQSPADLYLQVG